MRVFVRGMTMYSFLLLAVAPAAAPWHAPLVLTVAKLLLVSSQSSVAEHTNSSISIYSQVKCNHFSTIFSHYYFPSSLGACMGDSIATRPTNQPCISSSKTHLHASPYYIRGHDMTTTTASASILVLLSIWLLRVVIFLL